MVVAMPSQTRAKHRPKKSALTADSFAERFDLMVSNINKVIKGKEEVVRVALVAMLANGHVLFEDLPGTGKTMLARSMAITINAAGTRTQCTPDLLPADITGSAVLERKTGDFIFKKGPVFTNVYLVDEINRATPKTQAALLEAMQERTVSYDGVTHPLPKPFFVLATMNPIELAGTFPLPEAQLDRFLIKLKMGYTGRDQEVEVLKSHQQEDAIDSLGSVVELHEVVEMIDWAKGVTVSEPVMYYITDLVQATRAEPALQMGASARASLALMRAARVMTATQGRDDVVPDDVKMLIGPVIGHRIMLSPEAQLREETVDAVIDRLIHRVKAPLGLSQSEPPSASEKKSKKVAQES